MDVPRVPVAILEAGAYDPTFVPDPAFGAWVTRTFIEPDGALHNWEHEHLQSATIGWLWTNVENIDAGRRVLGTAQMPALSGKPWPRSQRERQILDWFGLIPDFIITLDGLWVAHSDPASVCALIEHELYHCSVKTDEEGNPKVDRITGEPKYAIRGHDVEQFVGVVRRYGSDAAMVRELVEAASLPPTIGPAKLDGVCGTCGFGRGG